MNITVWQRPGSNAPGPQALGYFAEGIKVCGDHVEIRDPLQFRADDIRKADVHVVYNPQFNNSDKIVATATKHKKKTIIVECGFFNPSSAERLDPLRGYWLAGYGSGVKGELDFRNESSPSDRWDAFGVPLEDWKSENYENGHILMAMQLAGDPSLKGIHPDDWAQRTIATLREHSDRGIVVRYSPYAKKHKTFAGCLHSFGDQPIEVDLRNATALCTYSSNAVVEALVSGIPVFADGPSIAGDLAEKDFTKIESPYCPDREQWAHNLGYAQWTGEEMRQGLAWLHLRDDGE